MTSRKRPPDEELIRQCKSHTQASLASRYGVTPKTIGNWCRSIGITPASWCQMCHEHKPRSECATEKRCIECEDAMKSGTYSGQKFCSDCGEYVSTEYFYWYESTQKFSPRCIAHMRTRNKERARESVGNFIEPVFKHFTMSAIAPFSGPLFYRGIQGGVVESP